VKILVTGATGFVGRWLVDELAIAGHLPIAAPGHDRLDVADPAAVRRVVERVGPDAIVHLAAIASRVEAARDPRRTIEVNVGGTANVLQAARDLGGRLPVLVASSSEVYARSKPGDGPLAETAPLAETDDPYARSKQAAEAVTLGAADSGQRVVITRAFNHTGPGQRTTFAIPAFARRITDARDHGRSDIVVGHVDVERDIGDVRDTVRAYRLLIEALAAGGLGTSRTFNIATGRAVSLRDVIDRLGRLAGIDVEIRVDPALVRKDDPPLIVGDASALRVATGWEPTWDLDATLAAVLADAERMTAST
jgi:GDP-4-dehydro-6-deoxy-D-mannose reductase